MSTRVELNQQLHEFPLPAELEGMSLADLAQDAGERLGSAALTSLDFEESEALSNSDNRVYVLRADGLPGACFKYLSAMNSVAEHIDAGRGDFVVPTAGSYGVGVGHAINAYGGRALALVPAGKGDAKKAAMRELGVEIQEIEGNFDATLEVARKLADEDGMTLLHPYAQVANIAATGTLGRRIAQKMPDTTHLVTQFGGGSLHGGVASVLKELSPDTHVTVAQMAGCSPFVDSVRTGEVREARDIEQWHTSYFRKLGGVGVGKTDPMTLGVGSRAVDAVTTTRIDHVYATMHEFKQRHGVLPEVAAAVGLTAARDLARTPGVNGAKIVAILTGANPEAYKESYLEGMYRRRQGEEAQRGVSLNTATALT